MKSSINLLKFLLSLAIIEANPIRIALDFNSFDNSQNSSWQPIIENIVTITTYYTSQFVNVYPYFNSYLQIQKVVSQNSQPLSLQKCANQTLRYQQINQITDFVLFTTIVNNVEQYTVASSVLCDSDNNQNSQPTAGVIIYNLPLLNRFSQTDGFHFQRLIEITLREYFHLFAMNINLLDSSKITTNIYNQYINPLPMLNTKKVVNEARIYFNCNTINQIPLVLNGSNYNILPSFLFQDILSDYTGLELIQRKISRITLAILEDTGWYTVDYSYAQKSLWGYQKGCLFINSSCNQSNIPNEFCQKIGDTSQCTFDMTSYGICQQIYSDPFCLYTVPQSLSQNVKLTCQDDKINIPWLKLTNEVFTPTSACFQSNIYLQKGGDSNQRCYQYSCQNGNDTLDLKIGSKNVTCQNNQQINLTNIAGKMQCPNTNQIHKLCQNAQSRTQSQYCSMKGVLLDEGCFCGAGFQGKSCDEAIICDQTCNKCFSNSALQCTSCISGYTLQYNNSNSIGWCQQNSTQCATNCSRCQSQNQSQCIQCQSGFQLAEVNLKNVGYCIDPIQFCQRIKYDSNLSYCVECQYNYILQQQICYEKINNCKDQVQQTCNKCADEYHLGVGQNTCVRNIDNCQSYQTDEITCKNCTLNYQLDSNMCYGQIINCQTQTGRICELCTAGYHLWNQKQICNQDIQYCDEYANPNQNYSTCQICRRNYNLTLGGQCVPQIQNCQIYQINSNASYSLCQNCSQSYHTNSLNNSCQPDTLQCIQYKSPDMIECVNCSFGYELIDQTNQCYPQLPNCLIRFYQNLSQCYQCINAAYTLSSDKLSCNQPIQNCLQANISANQSIICETCMDGYHVSTSMISCIQNITNCQNNIDSVCTKCYDNYNLQNNQCYSQIMGCFVQVQNICKSCNQGFSPLTNGTCIQPQNNITNCHVYNDSITCANCSNGYQYDQNSNTCFQQIANCTINAFNSSDGTVKCLQCNSNYSLSTSNLTCIKVISNCQVSSFNQSVCYRCQRGYTLNSIQNQCLPSIQNCSLRNIRSPYECFQCTPGYQLVNNSQTCYNCPIDNCKNCILNPLLGLMCQSCINLYQSNPQRNQCVTSCQATFGLLNCLTCVYNSSISSGQCNSCVNGYYLQGQQCNQCLNQYANCVTCNQSQCIECQLEYYYNSIYNYCESCNNNQYGSCQICSADGCLQCQQGYQMSFNGQCKGCSDKISNCDECYLAEDETVCTLCNLGYFLLLNSQIPCISCQLKFANCSVCSINNCIQCNPGYYLNQSNSQCVPCAPNCLKCSDVNYCWECQNQLLLLQNGICSQDIVEFYLDSSASPQQALAYSLITLQNVASGDNFDYAAQLDPSGYFCTSDQGCNMNGICLKTGCKCLSGIIGTKCQYQNSSANVKTINDLQTLVTSYLNNLTAPLTNNELMVRINLLASISDTSPLMSTSIASSCLSLLKQYVAYAKQFQATMNLTSINSVQIVLLNLIASLGKGFENQPSYTFQNLNKLEYSLDETLQLSGDSKISFQLPKIRIIQQSFNLKDPLQLTNFKNQFSQTHRILQQQKYTCNNQMIITQPQITLTNEIITQLQESQTSAQIPLKIRLVQLYYNPNIVIGQQQINSTVYRIQFIINGTYVFINNLNQPNMILIPNLYVNNGQMNQNTSCLQWNKFKQIWDENGMNNTLTVNCPYYTACYTYHFTDFAYTIIQNSQNSQSQTSIIDNLFASNIDAYAIVQNSGFYISIILIVSFFILWTLVALLNKRIQKKLRRKHLKVSKVIEINSPKQQQQTMQLDTQGQASSYHIPVDNQQILESMNISHRPNSSYQKSKQQNKQQNIWKVYPFYSIFLAGNHIAIQLQQITLILLQIQVFSTITAAFLSIKPFKFSFLTIYYLVTVVIGWVSNYAFGFIAVKLRQDKKIRDIYWILYLILFIGLAILSIWIMYGSEQKINNYLLIGVAIETVIDLVICDLFVVYFYQSLFQATKKEISRIFLFIRFRGYFIDNL